MGMFVHSDEEESMEVLQDFQNGDYQCPNCDRYISELIDDSRCYHCGTRLDWSVIK